MAKTEASRDWTPEYVPPSILPERFKKGQFLRKAASVSGAMILKVCDSVWGEGSQGNHYTKVCGKWGGVRGERGCSEGSGKGGVGVGGSSKGSFSPENLLQPTSTTTTTSSSLS